MDRSETVERFRERLTQVLEESGRTRSAFAEGVGLDRSTLSQLLSPGNERLPRAETILAIARQAQVSLDWLLGASESGAPGSELVSNALEFEGGADVPLDERLVRWHAEVLGSKIRYIPTTLPDLLKDPKVIRYEFAPYGDRVKEVRLEQAEMRLEYSRRPETDMEVCSTVQMLREFALGHGIWSGLPKAARRDQLEHIVERVDELYPTFRWFLFDGLAHFAAPYTIFGAKRAAIYVGNMYLMLNGTEQIRAMTRHFDDLIRAAVVQPPDVSTHVRGLLEELSQGKKS